MTAIQIADSFDSFAIDHTPDGWPAVQQKQLTEAAAELRRLEAQLQKETAARQAAQIEAEALKERLVRADAEKCAAVLAERIAPNAPVQEPVHKLIYPGGGKALFNRLWHLTCNAVATQSGMRVRTDVMPMREMKEFLDHLCVLVDSPPQPVPAPVQEQQFTADELDLMRQWFESMQDTNRSFVIDADKKLHQKIIAAIQAAPRAEQPRKAVKLSDEEISTIAISNPPNVHIYARAIEQAVLKANGIEP